MSDKLIQTISYRHLFGHRKHQNKFAQTSARLVSKRKLISNARADTPNRENGFRILSQNNIEFDLETALYNRTAPNAEVSIVAYSSNAVQTSYASCLQSSFTADHLMYVISLSEKIDATG